MGNDRELSWICLGAAIVVPVFPSLFAGSSCRNAGCVGVGAASGMLMMATELALILIANVFATRAFNNIQGDRTSIRRIELWVFRSILIGVFLMIFVFAMKFSV